MTIPGGIETFIPEGLIPVEQAFGRSIIEFQQAHELQRQRYNYTVSEDEPENIQSPPVEKLRYLFGKLNKWAKEREIRKALYDGRISSSILTPDGKLHELPSEIWGSVAFENIVDTGMATLNQGAKPLRGRAFVRRDQFETVCERWDARLPAEIKERAARNAARRENSATEEPFGGYVPPYLEFMLKAAQELGLSENRRASKEVVEGWLREHWPSDFGTPTGNKISYMATFLRHPGDEKGGHFKPERTRT
jgi:hypothetical protein